MTSSYSEKITKVKNALENVFVKKTDIQDNLTSTNTNKPLSANQGKILNTNKVDKINGKSLSTNDFTNTYKTKLDNLDTLLESKANNTHTHGNLQNDGSIGTSNNVNKNVITDGNGKITTEDKPQIDNTVTSNSSNAVKSSAIYSELQTKQDLLSNSMSELDENGMSIFEDDGYCFYSTNNRIYYDYDTTNELHFFDSNENDVNFDDIILEGDSRLTNARTPTSHSHSISNITNLQTSLDDKAEESDLLDLIYPIGSIYMKKGTGTTSICPIEQTLGGTWTRIENRFLYASENGQGVGSTGGEESVTLTANQSGIRAHGHGMAHNHNHRHAMSRRDVYAGNASAAGAVAYSASFSLTANSSYDNTASSKSTTDNNTAQNASEAHNNMPPYIIVNVWERTA